MTASPGSGGRRRRSGAIPSRAARRREECLTNLLHRLTDLPHRDLWAAFELLGIEELDELCELADEIVRDLRATAAAERRRRLVVALTKRP